MPDISGFTQFVTSTEIDHAQAIIQELLEVLIESNQIGLEVSEVEGDAVFFYRLGTAPSFTELLRQVETMFTRFHHHLQLYDQQRICSCRACATASGLTLKIIAHFGDIGGYFVRQHQQLFGKEVIILHRLLKNNLHQQEYALFTHPLVSNTGVAGPLPPWYRAREARETYDTGAIDFTLVDLSELRRQLPPVEPPQYRLAARTKKVFTVQKRLPLPVHQLVEPIFNLPARSRWMDGVSRIEMLTRARLNRVGTRHRCVFATGQDYVMVTEFARIDANGAELVEMDEKGTGGCHFRLQKISEGETDVAVDFLVRNNPILLAFFNLFQKKKQQASLERSLDNLYHLCKAEGG